MCPGTGWHGHPQDKGGHSAEVEPDLSQTWGFGQIGKYREDGKSQVFHREKGVINTEKGKTGNENICVNSQVYILIILFANNLFIISNDPKQSTALVQSLSKFQWTKNLKMYMEPKKDLK